MLKKMLARLAALSIKQKALLALAAVLVVSGTVILGISLQDSMPVSQEQPAVEQQQAAEPVPGGTDESEDGKTAEDPQPADEAVPEDALAVVVTGKTEEDLPPTGTTTVVETTESKHTVRFKTNGGSVLRSRQVKAGTRISKLPTPYREGYIFLGWYYDKDLTRAVGSDDKVTGDLTLYASYLQEAPLETLQQVTFASAENVGTDFSIRIITEDTSLTAQAVLDAIDAADLTDPDNTDFIVVEGSSGSFTVTGKTVSDVTGVQPGFAPGSTYRIALTDDRLHFENQPQSAREFNFTTYQEEVLNLSLQNGIVYIPVDALSDITNDGVSVQTLSIALYQADRDGSLGAADLTEGTFTYGGELSVGDIVSVYEGLIPTQRTLDTPDDQLGDLAYVEITGRSGQQYSYKNAQPEDVIFEPDMLPVPADADLDDSETTITVDDRHFDYSADIYTNIELDSQTTVDPGDFIVFYTGTFGETEGPDAVQMSDSYGKVTAVSANGDGTTTVTFTAVSWEEIESAMEIYTQDRMTGAEMLAGVDTDAMEAEIVQQAIDSGFAEEATQYLASLALATENFTRLSDNMNLEDYKVTLTDGTPVSPDELHLMASGLSAEVEMSEGYPKATISLKPKKLGDISGTSADEQGLSIKLEVEITITIGKEGSDNTIEITVGGAFTEEVGVDLGAKSKTIWDTWGPFPYISEYKVTANLDLVNYTAVEFNATMVTKEKDGDDSDDNEDGGGDAKDIAEEIRELLESKTNGEDEEDGDENQNKLIQKYSEMLSAESDWIKLIDKNIVSQEQGLPPMLPIIRLAFTLDFVVQMDASVSVGFDFEYLEGKRYTFTVNVFAGDVSTDVVTLQEQSYELCFYALGHIGIKAGLEAGFKVGLFSTKIAAVGVEAGAGPFAELWGYFFYELKYTESAGRSQKYSGAMLIEVGAYFEVSLVAEAIGGKYSASLDLVDKEWVLWRAGRSDNVLDFTTPQEDMPDIQLKQHIRSIQIPDDTFRMTYLDLKDGREKSAIYNDYFDPDKAASDENRRNYQIVMTNDKFSYDPQTNTITVTPADGDKRVQGEMIITWINAPMSFSSRPIQRTISLYWDNLRDGYVIVPFTNGGTYIPIINKKYEAAVPVPADPEKPGYIFDGWYSDEELTVPYSFPAVMPASDAYIYAGWNAATDTPYRVEHYQEQLLSGEYELAETQEFEGVTDSYVQPTVNSYTGYNSPAAQELKVLPDGSAVLRYYYSLQRHTVTFAPGEIGGEPVVYELKYGGRIMAPQMAAKGYTFAGWTMDGESTVTPEARMGAGDLTYTALWTKNPDTSYRVEYYVQQTDGRYKLQHLTEDAAFTGTELNPADLRAVVVDGTLTADEKYTLEDGIVFECMTVRGVQCESALVEGNGKTVIKINYKRLQHNLTFDFGHTDAQPVSKSLYYNEAINVPVNVTRTGYTFAGWSINGETAVQPAAAMGTQDVTYTALWTANRYTVSFDKNNDYAQGTMPVMNFVYDEEQVLHANAFTRTHYALAGWAVQPGGGIVHADEAIVSNLTAADGSNVTLYAVWTPVRYPIVYNNTEKAAHANPDGYTVESETILLADPTRPGYTFDGWYDNALFSGDPIMQIARGSGGEKTLYAKWLANTDTPYRVEHYKQTLSGDYALADTDNLTGTSDTDVTPALRSYTGFTAPEVRTENLEADGSAVIRYEYTRNSYTLTFRLNGGSLGEGSSNELSALYEEAITLPMPEREGYGFSGWYTDPSFSEESLFTDTVMDAEDRELFAKWTEGEYGYTVNHYKQNVDGRGYTLAQSESGTGLMDHDVTPARKTYEGFTAPAADTTLTIGAKPTDNVVNYYYTRNQYPLSWDLSGGNADGQTYTQGSVYYGAAIIPPVPAIKGYSYSWDTAPAATMPAQALIYTAGWTANSYAVSFQTDGGTVVSGDVRTRTVAFDSAYGELAVLEKTGYTFDGWAMQNGDAVLADTLVGTDSDHTLYAQFTPIVYSVTYHNVDGALHPNPAVFTVEAGGITLADAEKPGYSFLGWFADEDLTVPAAVIEAGGIHDREFYAKWAERAYTVTFHSNNGEDLTTVQSFTYTEEKALDIKPETYARYGYTFLGWSTESGDKTPLYTDGQTVSKLSPADNGAVHLYAVWKPTLYEIRYENMDGAVNAADNPVNFSIENNMFTLHEPARTGYAFDGWYLDAELTTPASGVLTLDSLQTWTFYAKWTPNLYVIVFDSCLGTSVPTETMLMTYDQSANLTLLSEITRFVKPGYTFRGWSTTNGGNVEFTDGQNVMNLATEGSVTLYAVWELNVFGITYDLSTGASKNNAANPTTYSIESGDVTLLAPTAKSGYQFLGWYDGSTRVTQIVRGTQQNYNLTARWAHGGFFTIQVNGQTNAADGYNIIFKVVRTLPAGTVATANPQYVYYRTVNGTAYGNTVDAGGDKYHFKHVGGENVYLTFDSTCGSGSYKTFTVNERDTYAADDMAATFQINNTSRYYNVELYKVLDTVGGCQGSLGSTRSVKRTISANSSYTLTSSFYNWCKKNLVGSSAKTVTDSGYDSNTRYTVNPRTIYNDNNSSAYEKYRDLVATSYGFCVDFDIKEVDDGYQWAWFNYGTSYNSSSCLAEYRFATKDGEEASNWGRRMTLPNCGTSAQGDILFSGGDCKVTENWTTVNGSVKYAKVSLTQSINFGFDAAGKKDDDWQYRNLDAYVKVCDNSAPTQVGIAPLALTRYRTGDTISITVYYDEVIDYVSGVSLKSISALPIKNATYVAGRYTNALTFTATVTRDFEVTPDLNYTLSGTRPVSGTVEDILGN